jgi:hypothetical protein
MVERVPVSGDSRVRTLCRVSVRRLMRLEDSVGVPAEPLLFL